MSYWIPLPSLSIVISIVFFFVNVSKTLCTFNFPFSYLHAQTVSDPLNATSHKFTATLTIHSSMYHSAPVDLRMLILPSSMTDCISDIRSWTISDNLMLNDDKTEF